VEHAEGEASVLKKGIERGEAAAVADGFFGLVEAAEFEEGLAAGLFGRHAGAEIVFDVELEMRFEFGS